MLVSQTRPDTVEVRVEFPYKDAEEDGFIISAEDRAAHVAAIYRYSTEIYAALEPGCRVALDLDLPYDPVVDDGFALLSHLTEIMRLRQHAICRTTGSWDYNGPAHGKNLLAQACTVAWSQSCHTLELSSVWDYIEMGTLLRLPGISQEGSASPSAQAVSQMSPTFERIILDSLLAANSNEPSVALPNLRYLSASVTELRALASIGAPKLAELRVKCDNADEPEESALSTLLDYFPALRHLHLLLFASEAGEVGDLVARCKDQGCHFSLEIRGSWPGAAVFNAVLQIAAPHLTQIATRLPENITACSRDIASAANGLTFARLTRLQFSGPSWKHSTASLNLCGSAFWQSFLVFLRNNSFPSLGSLSAHFCVPNYSSFADLAFALSVCDLPSLTDIILSIEVSRGGAIELDSYDRASIR